MMCTTGIWSLFFKRISHGLIGLFGCCVDDILRAGTHEFLESTKSQTKGKFQSNNSESPPFEFTGLLISQDQSCNYTSQEKYVERLELLGDKAYYDDIRPSRAKPS